MNIIKLKEKALKNEIDFYEDFYNLLNEDQKDLFFWEDFAYTGLKPDEFFEANMTTNNSDKSSNLLLLELLNTLQLNCLAGAFMKLKEKWYIDGFNIEFEDMDWIEVVQFYFYESLDEGGLQNFEINSIDPIFNNCMIIDDYFDELIDNKDKFLQY